MKEVPAFLRSPMTWLLVIVVIAAVVVFAGSGDDSSSTVDPDLDGETGPIDVYGDALPPYADADTGIGFTIPRVRATLIDGGSIEVGPDGTARVIGFFAHWCPACQAEMPAASRWLESTTLPAGVEFLAVSTAIDSTRGNYPPSEWFEREGWPASVIRDDAAGSFANAYGLTRFPYWVAVNADGTVAARTTGGLTDAQLDDLVELVAPADATS